MGVGFGRPMENFAVSVTERVRTGLEIRIQIHVWARGSSRPVFGFVNVVCLDTALSVKSQMQHRVTYKSTSYTSMRSPFSLVAVQ